MASKNQGHLACCPSSSWVQLLTLAKWRSIGCLLTKRSYIVNAWGEGTVAHQFWRPSTDCANWFFAVVQSFSVTRCKLIMNHRPKQKPLLFIELLVCLKMTTRHNSESLVISSKMWAKCFISKNSIKIYNVILQ